MPIYAEDDDDEGDSWRGDSPDGASDESPDERDLAKEGAPVRCMHCGKWIHEDAQMCPRCHAWQTDEHHPEPKRPWYVWTAPLCVALIALYWVGFRCMNW